MTLLIALLIAGPIDFPQLDGGTGDALTRISRLSGERQHYGDVTTDAHEWCHGLNNLLANRRWGITGVYLVTEDRYTVLRNPRGVTLAQAAAEVPADERAGRFDLYFRQQQQYFADQPFYIFDELSCYHAGAVVSVEKRLKQRTWDNVAATAEFVNYGAAVLRAVRKRDPGYADMPRACSAWLFFHERVAAMIAEGKAFGADLSKAEQHRSKTTTRRYADFVASLTAKPTDTIRR